MEHPGGQAADAEDNAYLQKVDVNALNPAILQKFLSNGLQEETENFVKDYFYAIGQEPMESLGISKLCYSECSVFCYFIH